MVGEENNENIEISEVKHKVAFDLDEKGIEGAATTVHQISFRFFWHYETAVFVTFNFQINVSTNTCNSNPTFLLCRRLQLLR